MLTGYLSPRYAESYDSIVELPSCSSHLFESSSSKLTNLYPFLCSSRYNLIEWSNEFRFNKKLKDRVINIELDPFLYPIHKEGFKVSVAKEYNLVDLKLPNFFSHHNWDNIHHFVKSNGEVKLRTLNFINYIEYARFFNELSRWRFNEQSLIKQFNVPGLVIFECLKDGQILGIKTFYIQNNKAYFHYEAGKEEYYKISGNYGINYEAINFFRQLGLEFLLLDPSRERFNLIKYPYEEFGWSGEKIISWKITNEN